MAGGRSKVTSSTAPSRRVRTLTGHPGAIPLLARLGGASQFLADALRRRPSNLAWLLEPSTMRVWLADDLEADLTQSLQAFTVREARMSIPPRSQRKKKPGDAPGRPGP